MVAHSLLYGHIKSPESPKKLFLRYVKLYIFEESPVWAFYSIFTLRPGKLIFGAPQ
jgi:hypothetical protein